MFAVVALGGKQYKVREKDELEVEKLDIKEGEALKIKEVLLLSDEEATDMKIGTPFVAGAQVECQVLEHGKGEKVRIFKKNPKKRYQLSQGHRQNYTLIKVLKISAVQKKAAVKETTVAEEKAESAEKAPKAAAKPAAKKKAAAKKD